MPSGASRPPTQPGPGHGYGGRYDEPAGTFDAGPEPSTGGFDLPRAPGGPAGPRGAGGFGPGPDDRFNGYEPGRHGKADMTAEIRMPRRGPVPGPPGGPVPGGPTPPPGGAMPGPVAGGPPPGPVGGPSGDLQRVDQIRRTFQVRRFGSGYDPEQVDGLFERILAGMSGRAPMPVNPGELDNMRFELVPGGYFEAEVEAALKEVKDILRGR